MLNNKKILAVVPARGGSKGIPGKNIYPLNGIPLICYTLREAAQSKYIDKVVVSTDDNEIANISRGEMAQVVMRPAELAQDHSKTISALMHAIGICSDYDILILLQPTSPLRTARHIDEALELFFAKGELPLCSVSLVSNHPVLIRTMSDQGHLKNLVNRDSTLRRQDMEQYYTVNGAIYIIKISQMTNDTSLNDSTVGYTMDSLASVDIDEESDMWFAETILTHLGENNVEED